MDPLNDNKPPVQDDQPQGLQPITRISGRALFPENRLQAVSGEVVTLATVALIDPLDGKTLSAGRTDAAGTFSLTPDDNFAPTPDGYYYLEVLKRLNGSAIGSNVIGMRTVLKWTAAGWVSITNGTGGTGEIVVNPTTTAMVLLRHEGEGIGFAELIGKVSGAPGYTSASAFGSYSAEAVTDRATDISELLLVERDPLGVAGRIQGRLAPDDDGNPLVHHDYVKKVGGTDSAFVWIPVFTAYQLLQAADGKPEGYWLKDRPAGAEGTAWAKETFGGFYAAKYEAARVDATSAATGTGTTLKVAKGMVPWTYINWDNAVQTCRSYDPHAYLMNDEEWTALAVWSMTRNPDPVYGNNSNGKDTDLTSVTFTDDPTHTGTARALTGSGTHASWANGRNLTTHTGSTVGVYDLNGNVAEWTSSLGLTDGQYQLDGITLSFSAPGDPSEWNIVKTLATHSSLRRYGLPGETLPGVVSPFFGGDALIFNGAGSRQSMRGGHYNSKLPGGVWAIDLRYPRSTPEMPLGFRPVLRY
jgi:hypothetical protein